MNTPQWLKHWLCTFPGKWHSWSYDYTGFDGASAEARCQWCGYEGLIDSQGGLF